MCITYTYTHTHMATYIYVQYTHTHIWKITTTHQSWQWFLTPKVKATEAKTAFPFFISFLNFIFWLNHSACGSSFSSHRLNLHPLCWKHGVLTTGSPGNSQNSHSFLNSFSSGLRPLIPPKVSNGLHPARATGTSLDPSTGTDTLDPSSILRPVPYSGSKAGSLPTSRALPSQHPLREASLPIL